MGLLLARPQRCVCRVALAPPFLLGPPCMETFLNKPRTSSSVSCSVSSWVERGDGGGGTEPGWAGAGHPPAHRGARSPTKRESMGGNKGER